MGVDILHEDRDIIVVNKAAGLLTMGTGRDGGRTAFAALLDYVQKGNYKSRERVFIVHRLDRDTSGALVFARSEQAKMTLQDNWATAEKTYLAFVEGHPDPEQGTISSHLAENEARRVYSTKDPDQGRLSHTKYKVLKAVGSRTLLEINLLTGRKNQIRVHLADKGWPIVGDSKYGRKIRNEKRLALLRASVPSCERLTIAHFDNRYLVDYAIEHDARFILRGIRSQADYEYERMMRHVNNDLAPEVTTTFLMPPRAIAEVSSSMVKGLIGPEGWQDTVRRYVPQQVYEALEKRLNS